MTSSRRPNPSITLAFSAAPGDAGPYASAATPIHLDLSAQRAAERVDELQAALSSEPAPSGQHRVALLAALAIAQSLTQPDLAQATVDRAEELAATVGTPGARVYALTSRYAIDLSPDSLPRRLELSGEAIALLADDAAADLRPQLLPMTYFMHLGALMEAGDVRALDEALSPEVHSRGHLAEQLDSRYAIWFRCARATMDGNLALAEELADAGYRLAVQAGDVDADAVWTGQIAIIRWMQGRVSEMEPVFLHARQTDPAEPVWAASVAWIWSHQGRVEAARGLIESLPDVDSFARGRNWLAAVAILAEVAAEFGSDDLVERLRRALLPFADRVVTIGLGVTCWGTAARPLALLARRQGQHEQSRRWYEQAIATCSRIGAQAWLAQAQVELAALDLEQGDLTSAQRLAIESVSAARSLGLRAVEQRADRILGMIAGAAADPASRSPSPREGQPPADRTIPAHVSRTDPPAGGPAAGIAASATAASATAAPGDPSSDGAPPADPAGAPRITVLGRFSVVSPEGVPARWTSRKARTLLKMLLARRGAAVARESAMEQLWPDEHPDRLRNRFSVAMTAVRKALDPHRLQPMGTYLVSNAEVLRLRMENLSVDTEDFFGLAERARAARDAGAPEDVREKLLRDAVAAYTGDAFAEDPYAPWSEQLRRQAHLAFFEVSHALADLVSRRGDDLVRAELYQGILDLDPYDQRAHDGLIHALEALGASGHLAAAREERQRRMAELGIADAG